MKARPSLLKDRAGDEQFAGGFGYLTDGKETLSTLYPESGASFRPRLWRRLSAQASAWRGAITAVDSSDLRAVRRRSGSALAGDHHVITALRRPFCDGSNIGHAGL